MQLTSVRPEELFALQQSDNCICYIFQTSFEHSQDWSGYFKTLLRVINIALSGKRCLEKDSSEVKFYLELKFKNIRVQLLDVSLSERSSQLHSIGIDNFAVIINVKIHRPSFCLVKIDHPSSIESQGINDDQSEAKKLI